MEFVERDGFVHPVVVVPPGVRTPVCAKAQLTGYGGKVLVERDAVYVRTLNSNNTPSTAKVQAKDWSDLVEICFNNREADIGRFFRRHLAGSDPAALSELVMAIAGKAPVQELVLERLQKIVERGRASFQAVISDRTVKLPRHGSWEVALIVDGQFPQQTDMGEFANLLSSSNPSYTGWPVWPSSRQFHEPTSRPYVMDVAWETLIVPDATSRNIDFMRQQRSGCFYSYSAIRDDIAAGDRAPAPMTSLEPIFTVIKVGEALAVGQAFAKALQADEQTKLEFLFRWSGLKGRMLNSWMYPGRSIHPRTSQQDSVTSAVTVPIETAPSTLPEYVKVVIWPLFEVFEGFAFPGSVVDELIAKLLDRKL
ncbi:ATP-binding protein [Caballeronia sp. LjRoot34]|uniref:helix-turn-helix domain-containing protein n=1 Tax=Caballeronia sp. LjRoot34 TaxID=3342325 RepID=UPI003ED01585